MSKEDLLLELLADNAIPSNIEEFNSCTEYGEPQHWVTLPYDRSLEITFESNGLKEKDRYYSWRIHCNDEEFDSGEYYRTVGVVAQNTSDDMDFDTRVRLLEWAIDTTIKEFKEVA